MTIGAMSSVIAGSTRSVAWGLACAGLVSMLTLSACTREADDATESPVTVTETVPVTASPDTTDPTTPVEPSLPAGIPTAKPSPAATAGPTMLDASAIITLATIDPDTGGLIVGGYVSGVIEDGGDCQYIITSSSGESFTTSKEGVANNGSTSCGSTTVTHSRVPGDSYTVQLRYVNDNGETVSDAVKVDGS